MKVFLGAGLILAALVSVSCDSRSGNFGEAVFPPSPGDEPAFPLADHVDQQDVTNGFFSFDELFFAGDELFEVEFNTLDGVGALKLPDGSALPGRFSRIPPGGGRVTGPNGQSCTTCHNSPFGTAGGEAALNVLQDPTGTGVGPFNTRNPTSLFGSAVLQRLAEEITEDLHQIRDEATAATIAGGPVVIRSLTSKEIDYGEIRASRDLSGIVTVDRSGIRAVGLDLVVRPYGWKGDFPTLRGFVRDAALNELGMEPEELIGKDPLSRPDPDCDGVTGELTVGDITAMTIYIGAQEIPQSRSRLVQDGRIPPPLPEQSRLGFLGQQLFLAIECANCHIPELRLLNPVFAEPSLGGRGNYFDPDLDPAVTGLNPASPFRFNLVQEGDPPRLSPDPRGGARVELFGDLRTHNMGRTLADPIPTPMKTASGRQLEIAGTLQVVGTREFLTAELWGVGNSGPWLHDGRASSLEEAILLHGEESPPPFGDPDRSEAQESRDLFRNLPDQDRIAVVEFLKSLLHFAEEEEE